MGKCERERKTEEEKASCEDEVEMWPLQLQTQIAKAC